jgi:LPXTG-site transpeptidase (sortase) family protein
MTKKDNKRLVEILNLAGNILIVVSFMFAFFTFAPAAVQEVDYQKDVVIKKITGKDEPVFLEPPNREFSIVIPKIKAVAPVFENVNPFSENAFLPPLKKGVAHASTSALPGEGGNVYIFAHSTDSFYNVGRYNAIFYLLGKLEEDDEVDIYYEGRKIVYAVEEKKVVGASQTDYLYKGEEDTLTLQTCYPPGTTLKRLIVTAKRKTI